MIDIICYFTSKLPFVAVRFRDILKSVAFSRMSLLDWTSEEEEFSESYDEDSGDISVFYFFQFLCIKITETLWNKNTFLCFFNTKSKYLYTMRS